MAAQCYGKISDAQEKGWARVSEAGCETFRVGKGTEC